jgi:hypothetical protein
MGRSLIQKQVQSLKSELTALLTQIFGVATNKAPLLVGQVFNDSKARIQASLDLNQTLDPKLNDYISSLNIPDALKGIDSKTALDLVKNPNIDFKDFSPILNPSLDNSNIKSILQSGMPGTGSVLKELGQTLSGITGPAQRLPDFTKRFLSSDYLNELNPTAVSAITDPTFTSLDSSTRSFIASATFKTQPTDLLNLVSSGTNLPTDLAAGLLENKANPQAFITGYLQNTNLKTLAPELVTPLLTGAFGLAAPEMITLVASNLPTIEAGVKKIIGSGALSGLSSDITDFISHSKLDSLTSIGRTQIQGIASKLPINSATLSVVAKVISGNVNLSSIISQVGKGSLSSLPIGGIQGLAVNEITHLFGSGLNLQKLSTQVSKLNLSQFSNTAIGNLLHQGGGPGDLFKLGNLMNSGLGNKLGSLTDLIGSGALGSSVSGIISNINQLKSSFLGLTVLGQVASIGNVDKIVKEVVAILPVGNQVLADLLARIGPEINTKTQKLLTEKADRSDEIADLTQRKFARDFTSRGPAGRNRPKDDRSTNDQYLPKATKPDSPPISSVTDGPSPPPETNNI